MREARRRLLCGRLKAKQIRDFHKKLPAIVDVAIAKAIQVSAWIKRQAGIDILQVAVVTEIDRSTRVKQIGEENVGVEILRGL